MLRSLIAPLTILALLVTGCSTPAAAPTPTPAPTQAAATANSGLPGSGKPGETYTITGSQGEKVTVGSGLAEELKDFPVPGGFTLDNAGSMSSSDKAGGRLAVASWKGKASEADVVAFFKKAAADRGWKEDMSFTDASGGQLWFTTKEQLSYIITYAKQDDGQLELSVLAGQGGQATPQTSSGVAVASAAPASPVVTAAATKAGPAPTVAGPALADVSALPAELKDVPVPNGFSPLKDGIVRLASGGQFAMASATFWGQDSPEKVVEFYQKNLPGKGWQEQAVITTGEGANLTFSRTVDGKELMLTMNVAKQDDGGTEIAMVILAQ